MLDKIRSFNSLVDLIVEDSQISEFIDDMNEEFISIKAKEKGSLRGFQTFQSKDSGSKIAFAKHPFDSPNELTIEAIYTPSSERGMGFASKLLKKIIQISDDNAITLKLEPLSISDLALESDVYLNSKKLLEWYKRHGFDQIEQGSDSWLIRYPKKL
jgi:predicted GNAT family acetyltransferase